MKQGIILLVITIILIAVCGCTQTPTPSQSTVTITTPPTTAESQTVVSTTTLPKTATVSDNTIRIKKLAFDPANITVKVGSTVRWVNQDSVPHNIQFSDTHFSSVLLASSQSGSQKFDQPGVYDYICSIHSDMHGTVIVEG
ncbi:MAG: cupredoxin family copper-binding protein, partial [Methanoregula sp.]